MFELDSTDKADGSRERFVLLKLDQEPTASQVPLDIVLDRASLNRWIRVRQTTLNDDQIAAADGLRDRLREYAMPVAVLAAESLKEATESFKRINSSGKPMSDFHMVAALAFDSASDPRQQFAEARAEYLAPIGWDAVSDSDVLGVCAGLAKQNPAKLDVDDLANNLRKDHELIPRAFRVVAAAAELLRGCGVCGPEALPYAWQLITVAVFLGRTSALTPLGEVATAAVHRWFWLTTYGEVFAGGNSAVFDRSILALGKMLEGGSHNAMERDVTRKVRPVGGFDFRSARSKACALAMARYQDRGQLDGPAHRGLATGVEAMQLLVARGQRSTWWHLAIVTPDHGVALLRNALKRCAIGSAEVGDDDVLSWLGVEAGDTGQVVDLLAARRDRLLSAEKKFVCELGLEWASGG